MVKKVGNNKIESLNNNSTKLDDKSYEKLIRKANEIARNLTDKDLNDIYKKVSNILKESGLGLEDFAIQYKQNAEINIKKSNHNINHSSQHSHDIKSNSNRGFASKVRDESKSKSLADEKKSISPEAIEKSREKQTIQSKSF